MSTFSFVVVELRFVDGRKNPYHKQVVTFADIKPGLEVVTFGKGWSTRYTITSYPYEKDGMWWMKTSGRPFHSHMSLADMGISRYIIGDFWNSTNWTVKWAKNPLHRRAVTLDQVKPGVKVKKFYITPRFTTKYTFTSYPYQDEDGGWWAKGEGKHVYDGEIALGDAGIAPYHGDHFNLDHYSLLA